MIHAFLSWLDVIDPGAHRRIKGLRLVTAFAVASVGGAFYDLSHGLPGDVSLGFVTGGIALWASVSEARATRAGSGRDLILLTGSAALGASFTAYLTPIISQSLPAGAEWTLVLGAFLIGFLKRFGVLGAGIGSQFYIGQLLAYSAKLSEADLPSIGIAFVIATIAAVVPRVLSGPAEHPILAPAVPAGVSWLVPAEIAMGLQAAIGAAAIVLISGAFGLQQSAWAVTACVFVVANTSAGTIDRVRKRLIGTAIGVPLGLAFLPIAFYAPLLVWLAAALAMVIYAMALPERYDIACGAFAFALIVTLAATGESSFLYLAARFWETVLGATMGLVAATVLFPLRQPQT